MPSSSAAVISCARSCNHPRTSRPGPRSLTGTSERLARGRLVRIPTVVGAPTAGQPAEAGRSADVPPRERYGRCARRRLADPHPASELLIEADHHAGCGRFVEHHVRAESSERGWQHRRRFQRGRVRRSRLDRRLQHDACLCRQIMKAGKPVCPPRPREQEADTGEPRTHRGEIGGNPALQDCRPQLEWPQSDPDQRRWQHRTTTRATHEQAIVPRRAAVALFGRRANRRPSCPGRRTTRLPSRRSRRRELRNAPGRMRATRADSRARAAATASGRETGGCRPAGAHEHRIKDNGKCPQTQRRRRRRRGPVRQKELRQARVRLAAARPDSWRDTAE